MGRASPDPFVDLIASRRGVVYEQAPIAATHDVDGVHDLRVGSRRLRAALRESRNAFANDALDPFFHYTKTVTRLLGTARELDVNIELLTKLRKQFAGATRYAATRVITYMHKTREACNGDVDAAVALVDSRAYAQAWDEALKQTQTPKRGFHEEGKRSMEQGFKRLCKAHTAWEKKPSDEALHEVRKDFKKLRYVCEAFSEEFGPALDAFIKELKSAQNTLGDWNDLRVLRAYVSEAAVRIGEGSPVTTRGARLAQHGFTPLRETLDNRVLEFERAIHEETKPFFGGRGKRRLEEAIGS